jgi:hypothetical protein
VSSPDVGHIVAFIWKNRVQHWCHQHPLPTSPELLNIMLRLLWVYSCLLHRNKAQ